MDQQEFFTIKTTSEENRKIVLTNVIKMLTSRELLNSDNINKNIEKILNENPDKSLYSIKLDNPDLYYPKSDNTKVMYVKIINQKFIGITKNSLIAEFLISHKNYPKIIIVNSIPKKVISQVSIEHPLTELFTEVEFMINIIDHILVPKHILLTVEESNKVLDEYKIKKKNMQKFFDNDPIARYYNAKIGRIFTIIRSSKTTTNVATHKIVIKGSIMED